MLKIKPVETKEQQEKLCADCGIEYNPDSLAYAAYENDEFIGITQFLLHGGKAYFTELVNKIGIDDTEALFIMGRAALNYVDLHGTHTAIMSRVDAKNEKLVRMVGFKPDTNGVYTMELEGFFEEPCKH